MPAINMDRRNGGDTPSDDRYSWERRQALQLVAQLPDDFEASLRILQHCKLLLEFLALTKPASSRVT